jgi:hypothetical protein
MDFLWQRDPFQTGIRVDDAGNVSVDPGRPEIEVPGVDYLLACYAADYLGVV